MQRSIMRKVSRETQPMTLIILTATFSLSCLALHCIVLLSSFPLHHITILMMTNQWNQ